MYGNAASIFAGDWLLIAALRRIAAQLEDTIVQAPDVSEVKLIGGRRRELRVTLDSPALASRGLSPLQVEHALGAASGVHDDD